MDFTLVAVVLVGLFFNFTNGFHDAANAVATAISTRAVAPRLAVLGSALLNFGGAFVSLKVAATVGKGIVDPHAVTLKVVLAGLVGAIVWNLLTWYLGLPSSSSHALIGGLSGAAIAAAGFGVMEWHGLYAKVLIPAVASPVLAVPAAILLTTAILWLVRDRPPGRVNRAFRRLQLVSSGSLSLTHGMNDAQKTMGVIALALAIAHPAAGFHVPTWVIVTCAAAMALGTYAGGWRIIRTLGQRIAKIEPPQGFAAESTTATILWLTAHFGFPVSTTHVVSTAVLGAGAASRFSAVRWGIARNIVVAWLITLPCAGLVGGLVDLLTRAPGGVGLTFALAVVVAVAALAARLIESRRRLAVAAV